MFRTTDVRTAVLAAAAFLVIILIVKQALLAFKRGLRGVPGPVLARFTNIWRLVFVLSGNAHKKYRTLHSSYGPIVRTGPNVVDISDPHMIPIIYGINSPYMKSEFYSTFSALHDGLPMDNLFSTRDPNLHKALKRPVSQKFSMTSIRTLEYLVDPCSQIFTDAMMDLAGQPVDFDVWLQWYAFDVIGAITFSKRFGFMEQRKDISGVIKALEFGLGYGALAGQIPWIHPWLLGNSALMKVRILLLRNTADPVMTIAKMVRESLEEYEQRTAEQANDRQDFLAFLRQQSKSNGEVMPLRDMWNHLMNNLAAGSDTTAISLRAIFYYVLQNQDVYEKLQREIDEADKAGKLSKYVTYAESLQLEYLQLCMKEAMRMHPGVSFPLERVVPEGGAEICGKYLPGGTVVGINAAVIHRDRAVYGEDADVFRPSRWIAEQSTGNLKEMERTLLTFGSGVRTCIGKNISIMEMGKIVPQIMRQFDISWASEKQEWKVTTYWFAKQSGLKLRLTPRDRK